MKEKIDKWQLLEYFLNRQLRAGWVTEETLLRQKKNISDFLKDFDFTDVTSKESYEWFIKQKKKNKWSKSTLVQKLRNLKAFFKFLEEEGYIKEDPMKALKEPRLPIKGKRLAFNKAQLRRITECAEASCVPTRDRAIFFTLLTSGLYSSELCRVKRANVSLSSKTIYIKGKWGKEKRAPFSARAKRYLKKYLSEDISMPSSEYLFHRDDGRPLRYLNIYTVVSDVIARAFPRPEQWSGPLGGHVLRHSFIFLWLENGGSRDALKEMGFSLHEIRTYAKDIKRPELLKREFRHFCKKLRTRYGL